MADVKSALRELFGTLVSSYVSNNANLQSFIIGKRINANRNVLNGSCGIKRVESATISAAKIKLLTKQLKNAKQTARNGKYLTKRAKNVKTYAVQIKFLTPQQKMSIKLLLMAIV